MPDPLITVILPTYNGAEFLPDALASVHAQNYAPLEILIVDDGSTDNAAEIARGFEGVTFIPQPHRGRPAFGRNTGVRLARGEFIAFLDQDDVWAEGALAAQLAAFRVLPELQVVVGRTQPVTRSLAPEGLPLPQPFLSAALFRRAVFARVGMFDETLAYFGDDTDWFARAAERGVLPERLDRVTLLWRMHEGNASRRGLRDHAEGKDRPLIEVVRKALERKRARGEG